MRFDGYKNAMDALCLDESLRENARSRILEAAENGCFSAAPRRYRICAALAAAIAAIVAGAVTAAAFGTGFFGLRRFFERSLERTGADISVADSAEDYGAEERIFASAGKLSASIVSTACDGHYIVAIVEVDASKCDIPKGALPKFKRFSDDFHGGTVGVTLLSQDENIYTYGYYNFGFAGIPDGGGKITLGGFGYYAGGGYDGFAELSEDDLVFEIKKEDLNMLESLKSCESAEIEGITVSAELSPLGILWTMSDNPTDLLGIERGDVFSDIRQIGVVMRDGGVQGIDTGLLRSQNGWIDQDTGGYCEYIGFTAPVDISDIESVTFHGVEFKFNREDSYD